MKDLILSNPEIVRDILNKIKNRGSCKLDDFKKWFPQYFAGSASGSAWYHPPADIRQLILWGLIDAFDGAKPIKFDDISDENIDLLTFRLAEFAIALENILEISLTARPFFGTPQPARSKNWADIFVLMPFRPEIDSVFNIHVQNVAKGLGLKSGRADNENFSSGKAIIGDIWSGIYHARFIIADCTGKNSNVFYEIGIAHTLGKPTILISQTKKDIPFDLQHLRYIIYENTPEGMKKLEEKVKSNLEELLHD
jgi:hypothetical protein